MASILKLNKDIPLIMLLQWLRRPEGKHNTHISKRLVNQNRNTWQEIVSNM